MPTSSAEQVCVCWLENSELPWRPSNDVFTLVERTMVNDHIGPATQREANFSTSEVVESEIGRALLFCKICKVAKKRHTAKDAVSSVVLRMHPLDVVLDMDANQFARTRSTVDG